MSETPLLRANARSTQRDVNEPIDRLLSHTVSVTESFEDELEARRSLDEEAPGVDVQRSSTEKGSSASGASWRGTAAVLLADMFGLGTLTLPGDYARLGWAVGLSVTLLSACGLVFSGMLFARLAQLVPRAKTFADYGDAAYGRAGRRLVYLFVYTTIALEPVIFQLICTENLLQMFHHYDLSRFWAGVAVAVFMLPLSQIQTLHEVSWLAAAGTLGMLAGIGVVFFKLAQLPSEGISHMRPIVASHPQAAMIAVMDIVFTYGGQVNWARYIAGMKKRRLFSRATTVAAVFMTVIYVALGLYGYYVLGHDFDADQPVTSIFPPDAWVVAMNAGIFVHCIIAYQINLNVWADTALHLFKHEEADPEEPHAPRGRTIWAGVSAFGIAISFIIAQVVPYFSLVMAIIAAIGDVTAAYLLPPLFVLKLSSIERVPLPRWQTVTCCLLIPVAIALSGLGLASSVVTLVTKLRHRFD